MDSGAGAVEPDRELEALDAERDEERARPRGLDLDLLERLPFHGGECVAHLGGAVGERAATGQPAECLQRRLLALGSVDAANAAAREPELDQLLERLRLVVAELAVLDRGDEVGKPAATLPVVDEREHRLRLAERDLGRVASNG